mmetsp:Transcript_11590/g.15117  ORF Transcript_11590/g.15117 Transcript_11590/m.15117 type:complete len:423 (+) Transcript_11590:91-1359(+)
MANETASWIGFGLLLLCAFSSPYIVRLFFSISKGLQSLGVPVFILRELRRHLLWPITLNVSLLFIFLAFFVALPVWDNAGGGLVSLEEGLFAVYLFVQWVALMVFIHRLFSFCRSVLQIFLKLYNIHRSTRAIVFETFAVVTFFAFVFVFLATFGAFVGNGANNAISESIIGVITRLNFLTATILIALAPVLRDAVAGFTIYGDALFQEGDMIEITGICPIGRVEGLELRSTLVRLLDKTLLHLHNRTVLRRPLVNYSKRSKLVLQLKVPLPKDISSRTLRLLIKEVEGAIFEGNISKSERTFPIDKMLQFNNSSEHDHCTVNDELIDVDMKYDDSHHHDNRLHASVSVDDTVTLIIQAKLSEKGFVGDHKQRTNLMLVVIEVLQKYKIDPRAPATFGYLDTVDTSTLGYISTFESIRNREE